MSKSFQKYTIFSILISVTFCSCTEKINLELDEGEKHIVIEAAVSNSIRNQLVRISQSSAYYDSLPIQPFSGATVSITDSSNIYVFIEVQPGIYLSSVSFGGKPGQEFHLKVLADQLLYEASSIMPRVPSIDSIQFSADEEDSQLFHIGLFAQENPLPGDFYFWGVFKDQIYQTTNLTMLSFASDELINGSYFNGNNVQSASAKPGNRISLQMANIQKNYFDYCTSVLKETIYNDGVFETSPANIKGNISNGALGFFFTYAETLETRLIKIEN